MRVFVTGATGYIGGAVCSALKAAGHTVVGLARTAEKAQSLEAKGYLAQVGALSDLSVLAAAAASADAVIHTAIEWGPGAGDSDKAATSAMLVALAGSKKPFIYTSGAWVYGDTRGRMLGELAILRPPALVAWRVACEKLVLDSKERGVSGVVLRPAMVFGNKGGAIAGYFKSAQEEGVVRVVGDGQNHWSNVHVDDLAALYVHAVTEPYAGEVFLACGGMPQPVSKIAEAVAEVCGIPGKVEYIPVDKARETMGPIADCLALDIRLASTKAARYFGWAVRRPSILGEIESETYLR